jgi:hypothetical protein
MAFSFFSPERAYLSVVSVFSMCAELTFEPSICVLWPYLGCEKIAKNERAKVVSGVALSTILKTRRAVLFRGQNRHSRLGCPKTRTSD